MSVSVTFVINVHREGRLCIPSLQTASLAVDLANKQGIETELLVVADNPDSETLYPVRHYARNARVQMTNVGDLGAARNQGVEVANGDYIAFMDGDDLCCADWIIRAYAEAESYKSESIVHPKFNLFFGRDFERYFWIHPDCRETKIRLSRLIVENLWTSSVFAKKTVFSRFPYVRNNLKDGIGYEDWVFNIEAAVAGVRHIVAPDTILFIRRNKSSSLLDASNSVAVIPDIARLFGSAMTAEDILNRVL